MVADWRDEHPTYVRLLSIGMCLGRGCLFTYLLWRCSVRTAESFALLQSRIFKMCLCMPQSRPFRTRKFSGLERILAPMKGPLIASNLNHGNCAYAWYYLFDSDTSESPVLREVLCTCSRFCTRGIVPMQATASISPGPTSCNFEVLTLSLR